MKKFLSLIAFLMLAVMTFSFIGCNNPAASESASETENSGNNGETPFAGETTPATDTSGSTPSGGTQSGGSSGSGTTTTPTIQETPLTLEAVNACTITLTNPWTTFKYKKNGGEFQTVTTESVTPLMGNAINVATIEVTAGDKIAMYADGSENSLTTNSYFTIRCSDYCYVYGNIMSLQSSTNFSSLTTITGNYAFYNLFSLFYLLNTTRENKIMNHSEKSLLLPATTLTESCYESMFDRCTGLTTAPELPATTLAERCYTLMFNGCTGLNSAPELPATTLENNCYYGMFHECTRLISAPELPATTLANNCYREMFWNCQGLTSAPALPATTLTESCYNSMFYGCTELTVAPDLPATTLIDHCYHGMFNNCSKLNYVKCLAENAITNNTDVWLQNTSNTGTFIKANGVTWSSGANGIPGGWTIRTAEPEYRIITSSSTTGRITASVNSSTVSSTTENATVTLTANPATGYELSTITVEKANGDTVTVSGSGNTRTFTMPAESVTVSATFTQINYTVTLGSYANGLINSSKTNNVHYGDQITLTAYPSSGYQLSTLTVTNGSSSVNVSGTGDIRTFTMPAGNVTVNASFTQIPQYNINTSGISNGTVSASVNSATVSTAIANTTVTLTASPDTGYQLSTITVSKANGGTVTVTGSENSRTFTMPAENVSVSATFTQINYTITKVAPATGGSISCNPSATYNQTVNLSTLPETGYECSSLTVTKTSGGTVTVNGTGDTRSFIMPAENVTITASFTMTNYSVSVGTFTNGSITASKTSNAHYRDAITLTIAPAAGYELSTISASTASGNVTLNGEGKVNGSTRTFTMPAANITISATFTATHLGTKDRPNAVGDIVFNDGTATPYSAGLSLTAQQKAAAIAVICYADEYNGINGLGLKEGQHRFCKSEAAGYAKQEQLDGNNGFNNTYINIKQKFKNTDFSEENYPAVWWVTHYSGSNNLGSYKNSWYLPAVNEYRPIYDNLSTIQAALTLIGSEYADPIDTASDCQYGSSTQEIRSDGSFPNWIKTFKFNNGEISLADKVYVIKVRALKSFD